MPFSSIAGQKVAGVYGVETEEGEIPRSGSSIEMIGRKEGKGGHDEGAVKGGSDFYDFYPSKASALGKNENYPKRGYYEDLTFIVLQGYDPDNSEAVSALTKKGGIFNWADEDLQRRPPVHPGNQLQRDRPNGPEKKATADGELRA